MKRSFRNIITGTICFALTLVIAVVGYVIAGWTVLDAVYMSVITVFGVGYGEVRPVQSPALRVFTILVIIAGYTSVVYIVSGVVQLVTEGEINRALGVRRMMKDIETLQQHVVLCGFGRMGQILARELMQARQAFVVIDSDPDRAEKAREMGLRVINGNATDDAILLASGIERAKVLASVLPDDAANVFITLTARGLNPNLTILARGEYPSTEKKLLLAGANHVVSPFAIGAQRMLHLITHPTTLDFLERGEERNRINALLAQVDIQMDEFTVPGDSPLVNSPIADLEVRGRGMFIVVAIRRQDGTLLTHPKPGVRVLAGDTIVALGHRGDIPQFARSQVQKRQIRYRGAEG